MAFQSLADWLAWQETLHPQTIDMGLTRVKRVLERMQLADASKLTISVAGTNGKGSCVAMLDAILRAGGYRVGIYTSPHLLKYNERIRIDGQPVSDERIMAAFTRIEQAREGVSLSFFEFGTLAALDLFAEENLDVRILEVGLGGRLDAVNIVDADVALMASIDIDHSEWLGHTREAIGLEKAGIARKDRPVVLGDPKVPSAVLDHLKALGALIYRQGVDFHGRPEPDGWRFEDRNGGIEERLPWPSIPGDHQILNAAAVLQCLRLIEDTFPISAKVLAQGLQAVLLPGRFQRFDGTIPVLIDVAHNPEAVTSLAKHLLKYYPTVRVRVVFAVMRDKDIQQMVGIIGGLIEAWYLAPLRMQRAASPEEIAEILHNAGVEKVMTGFDDVPLAVKAAQKASSPGDMVLVFGSFFLVSDYLALVAGQGGEGNG
jgi:dihydrofolate synthase/folylpolyglutamate synthase